ncbi:hypothetical protein JVU11DRAFT_10098 [Chiua virens]|nr:hypothetical protein JVU11DRAFT_10098 [Chiua virens]
MVPPRANQIPTYYHPTFEDSSWSSDHIRSETAKEQLMLKQDRVVQRTTLLRRRKGSRCKFWALFNGFFCDCNRRNARDVDAFIPHERWRAYGYSPHPLVNRVQVQSSAFRYSSAITISPEDLGRRSRSVNDSRRPDDRPGRNPPPVSHPPPYNWTWNQFPAPQDVRLHPRLQHRCNGPQPIFFDIALGPKMITHMTRDSAKAPLDPVHFAQPATHPAVTHMRIETVSEDPLPHFPWPIEITNAQGITCGDVFDAITRKFMEHVSEDEYGSWTPHRKTSAARGYHRRVRTLPDATKPGEVPNTAIGLRRLDYIGERVVFRGLEQAASMLEDTWFMYFGLA